MMALRMTFRAVKIRSPASPLACPSRAAINTDVFGPTLASAGRALPAQAHEAHRNRCHRDQAQQDREDDTDRPVVARRRARIAGGRSRASGAARRFSAYVEREPSALDVAVVVDDAPAHG